MMHHQYRNVDALQGHRRDRPDEQRGQHAVLGEDRHPSGGVERLPLDQAVERHAGVDGILAISGAGHPRFTARTGAAMRRSVGLDQCHAMALF